MVEAFSATATVRMVQGVGLSLISGFSGMKCCHQPNISADICDFLIRCSITSK